MTSDDWMDDPVMGASFEYDGRATRRVVSESVGESAVEYEWVAPPSVAAVVAALVGLSVFVVSMWLGNRSVALVSLAGFFAVAVAVIVSNRR